MSNDKGKNNLAAGLPGGPFASYAHQYFGLGLPVIPCGKDSGKEPLVRWAQFQKKAILAEFLDEWKVKFPQANIGMITGKNSGITVVDCDDPGRSVDSLLKDYGETPFVVETPRGGRHLYYKYSREKTGVGIAEKIDIRGDGGIIILPFSTKPGGQKYKIIRGNIDSLKNLPQIKRCSDKEISSPSSGENDDTIPEGRRNSVLFKMVKEKAVEDGNTESLKAYAYQMNEAFCTPSLPEQEVEGILQSIIKYKAEGRLFAKGQVVYSIHESVFTTLSDSPDALVLHLLLSRYNYNRQEFFIVQKGVAERLGWADRRRVKRAIDVLINREHIKIIYKGRGKGNPSRYTWS